MAAAAVPDGAAASLASLLFPCHFEPFFPTRNQREASKQCGEAALRDRDGESNVSITRRGKVRQARNVERGPPKMGCQRGREREGEKL